MPVVNSNSAPTAPQMQPGLIPPSPTNAQSLALISPTMPLAQPVASKPIPAASAPVLVAPVPQRILTAQEFIKEYRALRPSIAKAVDFLLKDGWKKASAILSQTDAACAADAMKQMKQLFEDISSNNNPLVLKDAISELSTEDVYAFAEFALAPSSTSPGCNYPDIFIDVLGIHNRAVYPLSAISNHFISYMPTDKLKILIHSICTHTKTQLYYQLASLIMQCKKPTEVKELLTEITATPFFKKTILKNWEANINNPPAEIEIDKKLAYHYLNDLLNDKTIKNRNAHIEEFLKFVQWSSLGNHCSTSPLQDQTVLDMLSDDQRQELSEFYCQTAWQPDQLFNSLLISNSLSNSHQVTELLLYLISYRSINLKSTVDLTGFYKFLVEKMPYSDAAIFKISFNTSNKVLLSRALEDYSCSKSAVQNPVFIDSLSKKELLMMGKYIAFQQPYDNFDCFFGRICKDHKLAIKLFNKCFKLSANGLLKNPYNHLVYCRDTLKNYNCVQAVVSSMTPYQKQQWDNLSNSSTTSISSDQIISFKGRLYIYKIPI